MNEPRKAVVYYQKALQHYIKSGNYRGTLMPEAVRDYADVLRRLGKSEDAATLQQQFDHAKITKIP